MNVAALPDVLRKCLSEAAEANDPLTDDELTAFLDSHTGGGCEFGDDCTNRPEGMLTWFKNQVIQGASRHDSMTAAGVELMSEVKAECYSGREAFDAGLEAFLAEFTPKNCDAQRYPDLHNEYGRIMAWAAAQADPQRAHREPDIDEERLWERQVLKHIYTASLAKQMDPRGVLAVVLVRAICSIPPYVTLPGITASRASLNLHTALVGSSSGGKSSSVTVAKQAVPLTKEPETATLGSGEGIAKAYAYRDRTNAVITITNTILFNDTEIESVEALAKRGGPLMSQWRKTFTGERLGFQYADPKNRIPVLEHRYRFGQILGIQPELCEWLLTGTQKAGGTPQRILWAPVQYPDMPRPEDLPFWPGEHKLPKWPLPQRKSKGQGGRNGQTIFTPSITNDDVSTAITEAELKAHELDLPPEVETMVRESRHRYHHGEMDELSGHGMLTRLKVAVGLMWLDGRTDKISSEDWELSGIVMAISDRTRLGIQRILDARGKQKERARGRSEAHREVAKAAQMAGERRKDLDRVKARIIARLAAAPGMTLAGGDLTRVMRSVPRELRDEAMAELADEGRVDIRERVYQGQTGYKYTLLDGS